MKHLTFITCIAMAAPLPAFAHMGHIAEVAGHGHLIGLGALAAAGVIAGLVARSAKKKDLDEDAEVNVDVAEDEASSDAA